ncbi:hypothetical protein Peur_042150 [Populus x canadensis]
MDMLDVYIYEHNSPAPTHSLPAPFCSLTFIRIICDRVSFQQTKEERNGLQRKESSRNFFHIVHHFVHFKHTTMWCSHEAIAWRAIVEKTFSTYRVPSTRPSAAI